jgi:hypothetical protein
LAASDVSCAEAGKGGVSQARARRKQAFIALWLKGVNQDNYGPSRVALPLRITLSVPFEPGRIAVAFAVLRRCQRRYSVRLLTGTGRCPSNSLQTLKLRTG